MPVSSSPDEPPKERPDLKLNVHGDESPRSPLHLILLILAGTVVVMWILQVGVTNAVVRPIAYSEFKQHLGGGEVIECSVREQEITGKIELKEPGGAAEDEKPFYFRAVRIEDPDLVKELQAAGIKFSGVKSNPLATTLLIWMFPVILIFAFWVFMARRMGQAAGGVLNIAKSKARFITAKETGVSFKDVAGCDEAKFELQEVVQFLKEPERFRELGARIPRGVLLVGPPGTGKTLLARAVAGEAEAPFFSISGSDFVEMFVGVGAARVRDLFENAKKHAPCIIFIDELDAIGRTRGVHLGAANDEREQTLNQLLVEMDGFDPNTGVIILSATNRPDVLDRALLRPGRFDRQVVVDAPDATGREAILKVHSRNKPLHKDVDLEAIARSTAGFSGADLANALNEAALLAARRGDKAIHQDDLEEAVEKVVAGPERKSRRLGETEKRRVAWHETGHALVAAYSEGAEPVQKISIVPRGRAALGYTLQWPEEEHFLQTRGELLARIRGMLGGRAAEEIGFDEVSTGASNDLEQATAVVRQLICNFGMSEKIGLSSVARREEFLPPQDGGVLYDCSEDTAREIDLEAKRMLDEAYQEAIDILTTHRDQLDSVAGELMERETIDGEDFYRMIERPGPKAKLPDTDAELTRA